MAFSELYYKYGEILANKKANYTGAIWHYTSSYGLKGIIENKNIWFSDRRFLNDPTECNYLYRLIAQNKYLFEKYNENFYGLLKKIVNNFACIGAYFGGSIYIPQLVCFVASFSCSKDNLELWNYYTKSQNSAGYAIKFSAKSLIKLLEEAKKEFIFGKVIYDKKVQLKMIKKLLDEYNATFDKKQGKEPYTIEPEYLSELAYILEFYNIFFKPEAYKNENEYRFVIYYDGYPGEDIGDAKFRIFNDIFIPYTELELPPNAINEIMVSPAVNQQLLQQGVNILKSNSIYNKAKTSLSEIYKRY